MIKMVLTIDVMKKRAISLRLRKKAHDLKSLGVRAVWVQVPLRVPWERINKINDKQCRETAPSGGFFITFASLQNMPSEHAPYYF